MIDATDQDADPSPSGANTTSRYATLFLQNRDKLCLLQFPADVVRAIEPLIRNSWAAGIQATREVAGLATEFKLGGTPFGTLGDKDAAASRVLVRNVLAFLYERGWILVAAVGTSRIVGSKDTMVFRQQLRRRQQQRDQSRKRHQNLAGSTKCDDGGKEGEEMEVVLPPPVDFLVVAICGSDKIRFIGGAPALLAAVRRMLVGLDFFQAAEEGGCGSRDCCEFRLRDGPWSSFRAETKTRAELLLLRLVEVLDAFGWRSYGTARQRTETEKTKKADSWFFIRPQDWVEGSRFDGDAVEPADLLG